MKILLVEDDQGIGEFIQKGFHQEGHSVDWSQRGDIGFSMAQSDIYDVLVLDIMLPEMDGLTLLEGLRSQGIQLPVIILSARQSLDDRISGLKAGGDDYLVKPFAFSELLLRVEALFRRSQQSSLSSESLSCGDLELNLLTRKINRAGITIELQPREYTLLELLLRNKGNVLTKTLILEKVWDWNFDPQTNVVDVLVSRLRSRIDKDFEPKLIHTVRGAGYVIRD